jgi:hypothetical protein
MRIRRDYASAVLFSALAAYILAASPLLSQISNPGVQQAGSVTVNHIATWGPGTGQIQDGGAAPVIPAPGGSSGNVQYNNSGAFGGLTNTQLTADINVATAALSGALPAWPNNTTTYFRGDGTYVMLNFTALGGSASCGQLPALTGDITGSGCVTTLASVNANTGSWGSATQVATFTTNAKGLITAAGNTTITPAFSSLTGSAVCGQLPALTGDATTSAGSCGTTVVQLQGRALSASAPSNTNVLAWNGSAWTPTAAGAGTVTSVVCGTGLTGGTITGTGTCALALNSQVQQTTSVNPASITGVASKMLGLGLAASGGGCKLTPTYSTRVEITFVIGNSYTGTNATGSFTQIYYGTSTAPSNGAAVTGTAVGSIANPFYTTASTTQYPFSLSAIVTGLSAGTAYWFDLSLANSSLGDVSTLANVTCNAKELL